jgi:flagellin-like protein
MKKGFKNEIIGVSPVIAVILMVAITVVLSGVLWATLSNISGPQEPSGKITIITPLDKGYGYLAQISDTSGSLNLEDAEFQIISNENVLQTKLKTSLHTRPAAFVNGVSTVYAMHPTETAQDGTTNDVVTSTSKFSDYMNCTIAYIDQNDDGKISSGDSFYIYKNPDGLIQSGDEVDTSYSIKIMVGNSMVLHKKI